MRVRWGELFIAGLILWVARHVLLEGRENGAQPELYAVPAALLIALAVWMSLSVLFDIVRASRAQSAEEKLLQDWRDEREVEQ